jgi:hypothetical protein
LYLFSGSSDLLEKEVGMEQMDSYSSLFNEESLIHEHAQTKLSRVARWAEENKMEVLRHILFLNRLFAVELQDSKPPISEPFILDSSHLQSLQNMFLLAECS